MNTPEPHNPVSTNRGQGQPGYQRSEGGLTTEGWVTSQAKDRSVLERGGLRLP